MNKLILLALVILTLSSKSFGEQSENTITNPQNIYEQLIDTEVSELLSSVAAGHTSAKLDLAKQYTNSYKLEKRKLAVAILKELVTQGDEKAIVFLATKEYLGTLGYVSEKLLLDNKGLNDEEFKLFVDDVVSFKNKVSVVMASRFDDVKSLYDKNIHLCEQPVSDAMVGLVNNSEAHLSLYYFRVCLLKYSVKNSRERLLVLSRFEEIFGTKESGKVSISLGYKALGDAVYTSNETDVFVAAVVLRNIFSTHKNYLMAWDSNYGVITEKTGTLVAKAYGEYKSNRVSNAVEMLVNFLNTEKDIQPFDRAYVQNFIAKLEAGRDGNDSRKNAIKYAELALSARVLNRSDESSLVSLLGNLYMLNKEHAKYIDLVGNYILRNQGDMDLVPAESIQRAKELLR